MESDSKKDSIISLKYTIYVPGLGNVKVVLAKTVASDNGRSKIQIYSAMSRGKWADVNNHEVWISEGVVASRSFTLPRLSQQRLF